MDKALLVRALKMAAALPAGQHISGLDSILTNSGKTPEQWVDEAYSTTKLKDPEFAKGLIGKTSAEIEKSEDPFIRLAAGIYPVSEEINKTTELFGANVNALRKDYLDALYVVQDTSSA